MHGRAPITGPGRPGSSRGSRGSYPPTPSLGDQLFGLMNLDLNPPHVPAGPVGAQGMHAVQFPLTAYINRFFAVPPIEPPGQISRESSKRGRTGSSEEDRAGSSSAAADKPPQKVPRTAAGRGKSVDAGELLQARDPPRRSTRQAINNSLRDVDTSEKPLPPPSSIPGAGSKRKPRK